MSTRSFYEIGEGAIRSAIARALRVSVKPTRPARRVPHEINRGVQSGATSGG